MEAQTAAVKSINAAMETEVGRKILVSKMLSLSQENRTLKRKVAEDRIAVHALNEMSSRTITLMYAMRDHMTANGIPPDEKIKSITSSLRMYQLENLGEEMNVRIGSILNDTTGDDLLLEDLIGKQPTEGNA
jgi:ubiquinone biosynthesis protein Coq4